MLGNFVDDCGSSEQCYAYYGDQIKQRMKLRDSEVIEAGVGALVKQTPEQLRWVGEGVRAGFVEETGTGYIISKTEVGREKFVGISKEKKKEFYAAMFEKHRDTLLNLYDKLNIKDLSTTERGEVLKKIGKMLKEETELHAQTARTVWKAGVKGGSEFEKWFESGEGHGFSSGEVQWKAEYEEWQESIKELGLFIKENKLPGSFNHHELEIEAELAYRVSRQALFEGLKEDAEGGVFSGEAGKRWALRGEAERALVEKLSKVQ